MGETALHQDKKQVGYQSEEERQDEGNLLQRWMLEFHDPGQKTPRPASLAGYRENNVTQRRPGGDRLAHFSRLAPAGKPPPF